MSPQLNMPQYPPHERMKSENVLVYMLSFQKIDGKKFHELKKMMTRETEFIKY